jgi:signal transduction histidine kinase
MGCSTSIAGADLAAHNRLSLKRFVKHSGKLIASLSNWPAAASTMVMSKRWHRSDVLLAFGPGSLADRPEGWVFVTSCCLALLLVFLADLSLRSHGTVSALGFIPVVVAGWLLSRRQAAVVTALAVVLRVLATALGAIPVVTGVTHAMTLPVLAILGQLAAAFVVKAVIGERQLERVRADRERLVALDGAKSEFLRLASHELRGPLGVVRGYISMLEDGTLGELPRDARRVLPILVSRLKSIGLMVDLMLETARLDDSRLQLSLERTDLRDVVGECVDEMRPLAGSQHPLQVDAPPEPVVAEADRRRVATIVTNLIDNAIKYSPDGGPVECRLEGDSGDGKATIAVRDHGIGISASQRKRLFARYSRVGGDRAATIPGTGLGLYVSRELARLHGGDLQVESELGEGSTFTLELPVEAGAAAVSE